MSQAALALLKIHQETPHELCPHRTLDRRRAAHGRVSSGEVDVAVGTHALIQQAVEFRDLGLAVIDEEHRFGVEQRRALLKGMPDVLVMSATPIPRTLFTLAAGVLFGPILGVALAMLATMLSALVAFVLVRSIGRAAVERRLTHPMVRAVEARLARRGWLAVGSLRMIGFVPFSVVNYCSAVSAVRLGPYLLATLVGIIPGTVSVVLFGDVLNTGYNPTLLAISAVGIFVGLLGLVVDARLGVDIDLRGETGVESAAEVVELHDLAASAQSDPAEG